MAVQYSPTPHSYSSAVAAGDFVFLGLHRGSGETFAEQCATTIGWIEKTLADLNVPLSQLIKAQVWLKRIEDLPEMEQIFHGYFEENKFPARMTSTTQFIDDDCLIMIEGIAAKKA